MSQSGLLVLACVLFEVNAVTNIIDPAVINGTGSFYIASEYYNNGEYYKSGSLTCNALYCHVVCDVASGCESLSIHTTSIVDTITLKCTETDSCYSLTLSGDIRSYADIHCGAERACSLANLDLIPTRSDINVDIICVNPSITTSKSIGACHYSYFDIYGYNNYGVKGSNMTFLCGSYDCNAMHLNAFDFNQFDLYCNGTYSCGSTFIYGEASNQFNVHCDNEGACGYAEISCPYHQEQACQIDCAAYPDSCASMAIKVPANYIYNYLDIQCPSEALYAATFDACYNLSITCLNDWREHAYLSYDFSDNEWNCGPYTASSYCCPYLETETATDPTTAAPTQPPTTKTPSKSPSKRPSKSPTEFPSKSPTELPSKSPTEAPSKSPTKAPSKSPTGLPSGSPTKTPSKSPSKTPSKSPSKTPSKSPSKLPSKSPTELLSKSPSESLTTTAPTIPSARETDVVINLSSDVTSAMDANGAQAQAQTDQSHYFGSIISIIVVFSSLLVILLAILIIVIIFYFRALDSKIGNPHDQSLAVELIEQNANRTNAQIEVNDADDDVDM
eukprot:386509_1